MLTLLAASALAAQFSTILDPADHASATGEYVLHVNPSTRDGAGKARYRLSRRGEPAWSAELPFTLREVAVTDRGFTVGYGFTQGDRFDGDFVVAIVGPKGELLLDERTDRTMSSFHHGEPNPNPIALVLDAGHDAFAVRVRDEDVNAGVERWWRFVVSNGKRLDDLRPKDAMQVAEHEQLHLTEARAVPGTDLHLLHWWRLEFRDLFRPYLPEGGVFTLMAPDGSVAWRLDLPLDYTVDGDVKADDELEQRVREQGAIREVGNGRFRLWFVREGQEVSFEVRPSADGPSGWSVAEVARAPYVPPDPVAGDDVPSITLAPLDSITLEPAGGASSRALRDIRAWNVAAGGSGFVAVRDERDGGRYTFVHVDGHGAVLREQPIDGLAVPERGRATWTHWQADEWLAVGRDWDPTTPPMPHRVNASTGRAEPLVGFVAPRAGDVAADLEALAPTPDGGFVALVNFNLKSTSIDALVAFDRDGRPLWTVHQDYEDPTKLFSPEDVAVTTDGLVVVVDNITHELRVFDATGEYVETIDLTRAFGSEPTYPSGISSAPDGAVLVDDFGGRPPLWHMLPDGTVLRSLAPHFADGRTPRELAREARFSPDGALWTFDGYAFLRVDEHGVAVEHDRDPASPTALHDAGTIAIVGGRICVQDERTAMLHVWNEDGTPAWVGTVEPTDADRVNTIGRIVAGPNGSLWVEDDHDHYLGWDARGARLGSRSFDGHPAFAPDGKHRWTWGHTVGLSLCDEAGNVLAKVERRPDDRWIRGVEDGLFADENTLAVVDGSTVLLYSANGDPQRAIDAPPVGVGKRLDARGDWLLLSSWYPRPALLRRSTGSAHRFVPPIDPSDASWAHGLSADGRRLLSLCVHGGVLTLHRFALP